MSYEGIKYDKTKYQIIVCRYNEDITYLLKYQDIVKIYYKNINNPIRNIELDNEFLTNWGQESYAYLSHIVKNYDNLANFSMFIQADPFEQNPYIQINMDNIQELNSTINMGIQWKHFHFIPNFVVDNHYEKIDQYGFRSLDLMMNANYLTNIQFYNNDEIWMDKGLTNVMKIFDINGENFQYLIHQNQNINKTNLLTILFSHCGYEIKINDESKDFNNLYLPFGIGGLFGTTKAEIKKHQVELYKCLNYLLEEYDKKRQISVNFGFVMERTWMILFNYLNLITISRKI